MNKKLPLLLVILALMPHFNVEAQRVRDPYQQPFAENSIWNTPVGDGAVYVAAGFGEVKGIHVDEDYIVLVPDAPLTPVFESNAGWGPDEQLRCVATGGVLQRLPIPKHFVISPSNWDGRTPNAGVAVLMADGKTIIQNQPFARCFAGEPATTQYRYGEPVDLYGDGRYGAHGGSRLSAIGGALRLGELVPGGEINHVLKLNVYGHKYLAYNATHRGYRWPAYSADSYASGPNGYAGTNEALRMGSLVALPATLDIETLGLQTEPAKILARTLQLYGAYVVDDTAWDIYALVTEFSPQGRVKDEFRNVWGFPFTQSDKNHPWVQDMDVLIRNLHVIDNNAPDAVGGGGNPIGPVAPEFGRAGNIAPQVGFSSPADLHQFKLGDTIIFEVNARDLDGNVEKVEFFVDGVFAGESNTAPYTFSWKAVAEESFTVIAKATDNEGTVGLSLPITLIPAQESSLEYEVLVHNDFNNPPYDNWVFKSVNHAQFVNGKLKLLQDDVRIGYYKQLLGGSYILNMDVMSAWGNSAGVLFHAQDLNNFYLVEITPANGGKLLLKKCTGNIWQMTKVAEAPAAIVQGGWHTIQLKIENQSATVSVDGTVVLTDIAVTGWQDGYAGVYSSWQPSEFDNLIITDLGTMAPYKTPSISITNPQAAVIQDDGNIISLAASVESHNFIIQKVEWYLDGYLYATAENAPYTSALYYLPAGDYRVAARLYTSSGLPVWSAPVDLKVERVVNNAPVVYVETPLGEAVIPVNTNQAVVIKAFDSETALKKVEIFINDARVAQYLTEDAFRYNWRPSAAGNYKIHAVAEDSEGALSVSEPVNVVVQSNVNIDESTNRNFIFYPNPIGLNDDLQVLLPQRAGEVTIFISDSTGKLIFEDVLRDVSEFDVSLNRILTNKGMYLVRLVIKDQPAVNKLLIVN